MKWWGSSRFPLRYLIINDRLMGGGLDLMDFTIKKLLPAIPLPGLMTEIMES